jgi:hypothetical protein
MPAFFKKRLLVLLINGGLGNQFLFLPRMAPAHCAMLRGASTNFYSEVIRY